MPKPDIHPTWYPDAKVICNGEVVMTTGSTQAEIHVASNWITMIQSRSQIIEEAIIKVTGSSRSLIIKNQIEALNINTHCVIIQNCGHAPFVSKPAETNNIVYQFLNERM